MNIKVIILAITIILLSGCASKGVDDIPNGEFKSFSYNRGGNFSSAFIEAKNAKIDGEYVTFDEVIIDTKYGPFVNFNIRIEGYKRKIK